MWCPAPPGCICGYQISPPGKKLWRQFPLQRFLSIPVIQIYAQLLRHPSGEVMPSQLPDKFMVHGHKSVFLLPDIAFPLWDYPSSQSLIACITASVVTIFKELLLPTSILALQSLLIRRGVALEAFRIASIAFSANTGCRQPAAWPVYNPGLPPWKVPPGHNS